MTPRDRALSRRVLSISGPDCYICGVNDRPQVDHIRPVWAGGRDEHANMWVLCTPCHADKTEQEARALAIARRIYSPDFVRAAILGLAVLIAVLIVVAFW